MLLDLLKNIENAVLAKNKISLMSFVDSFHDFLMHTLKNVTLNMDIAEQGLVKLYLIFEIECIKTQDNPYLLEILPILKNPEHELFLQLHLALELHEIKRCLEKDYHSNFGRTSRIFKEITANEVRTSKKNLTDYDLSFLSSQERQTVFGKIAPHSVLFFKPYLNVMDSTFWVMGDEKVFYMTTAEKKAVKVTRDIDGALIYQNTKKPLLNGRFLYVVSPKGGLYATDADHFDVILHHSTIRAGQPVLCSGFLEIDNGEICEIDHRSGHYRPDVQSLIISCLHLYEQKIITENCVLRSPSLPRNLKVQEISENEQYELLCNEYNELRRSYIPMIFENACIV
ncbi:hypothetical protein [uncultured Legionella sp.]|uniref:hypothetical protein n=1 Tax=uncultured Legionella sp. TaxID=210934 RepID=UPI002612B3B9|nr:hypothetical protein [uncultured Legionella sp.]